ncbi:MAG: thioesterase [Gammaproteobacteria bacterium RIFCSPHIGHO2_12_FULL_37_14]|nr:MAG: thioesterase [Gammaproteobacteria bacterium RIFCSPHIGHO2_12_FULL_37_14]
MTETKIFNQHSLQELAAPDGVCFGCGQKNINGLQIKSYWDVDNVHVIMTHIPDSRYIGWPSLVYGGLISCLVDCHSNWTVMAYHYRAEGREPGTLPRIDCVTGTLNVKYIKPTPMGVPLTLKARVEGEIARKTRVLCEVYAGDTLTVLGDSVFVRVDVGHLAKTAHE